MKSPCCSPHRLSAGIITALGLCAAVGAAYPAAAQSASKFTLEPQGAKAARLGYFPVRVQLSATKPDGIRKEPAYQSTPKYGTIHIGNGPKSTYVVALDEPEKGDFKIYFDANRNGDLTDDGDGAWVKRNENNGRVVYGVNEYTVRASYGTPTHETSSGEYSVAFYRIVGIEPLLMYRNSTRVGTIQVDGKPHKAMLVENDADGVYSKPLDDNGKPLNGGASRNPVWLLIDMNDDGKWTGPIDVRSPFKLGDKAYVADVSADGANLKLQPTTRKVPERPKAPESKPLLRAGVSAPNFEAEAWGGGKTHLADYRGKIVVLDFWATWCPPCRASMPHLEKVYQTVKDKNVVVLGLCVSDEKAAYEKWMPENKDKYHFSFAFDPAGRSAANISSSLYNVSGIPTTYIIDKEGRVADAIVGYSEGDKRIEAALKKLGVEGVE